MQLGGVINIGAEGMMLIGAFFGILGTFLSGYTGLGILIALIILAIFGFLFGLMTIYWKGNQVVVGVALNLLAEGMTTTLSRQIFGTGSQSTIQGFKPIFLGVSKPDKVKLISRGESRSLLAITLHEGRNRIVRRMMHAVGHPVDRLARTGIGPVRLGQLTIGTARELTREELGALLDLVDM